MPETDSSQSNTEPSQQGGGAGGQSPAEVTGQPVPAGGSAEGQPPKPAVEVTETSAAVRQTTVDVVPPTQPMTWLSRTWDALKQGLHLFVLLGLLYYAIGAASEISSRNEDYGRVSSHHKWLLTCLQNPASDKGCPNPAELGNRLNVAAEQVRRYDSLNSIGAASKCLTAVVIASPVGGFHENCVLYEAILTQERNIKSGNGGASRLELSPQDRIQLKPVVEPVWPSYSANLPAFDQLAKEHLYFLLVLVASAIGSLIAGLRTTGFTTLRDLTIGLGVGFAVYLLLRSGNFVFLATPANIDILNPFAAAAVGLLVGLFSGRVLTMLDGLVGTKLANAAEGTGQVSVVQSEKTTTKQVVTPTPSQQ